MKQIKKQSFIFYMLAIISVCIMIMLTGKISKAKTENKDIYFIEENGWDDLTDEEPYAYIKLGYEDGSLSGNCMLWCWRIAPEIQEFPSEYVGCKVTQIGEGAAGCFLGVENLTTKKLIIPDTVEIIGNYAFQGFAGLESIEFPDSVKEIRGDALNGCYNLKSIRYPRYIEGISHQDFSFYSGLDDGHKGSLETVYIPITVKEIAAATLIGVKDIYYEGTASDWEKINIFETYDGSKITAKFHYEEYDPKLDISKAAVSGLKSSYTYTGKEIQPKMALSVDSKKLALNKDYTVTYKNNKKCGVATIKIAGKGRYTGTDTKTFKIAPTKVKNLKAKAGKSSVKLSWTAAKASFSKYEILVSTSKKFTKKTTKKYTAKAKAKSISIKQLKAKKKYYVKMRAYKTSGKTNIYGEYSKVVAFTTKK